MQEKQLRAMLENAGETITRKTFYYMAYIFNYVFQGTCVGGNLIK
jgi:hypothetical protein